MMIHSVYFWLKDDLEDEAISAFEAGLEALCAKTTAVKGYYGKPAATPERDVIESSYTYGLVLFFEDLQAHDVYQVSDVHQGFIADHNAKWTTVKVLDIDI